MFICTYIYVISIYDPVLNCEFHKIRLASDL